jgi:hypothetical protein
LSADGRLYLVTRRDLSPGAQAVQSCHVLRLFVEEHTRLERGWFRDSNRLVLLSVADELALQRLLDEASRRALPASGFREPDLGHALTAVALAPGLGSHRLCRDLPLALGP